MYRYDLAPPLLRLTGVAATHTAEMLPVFGEVDGWFARVLTAGGGRPDGNGGNGGIGGPVAPASRPAPESRPQP